MSPSPRPLSTNVSFDRPTARAAILFTFFRAGQTSIEIAHAAADPNTVPSPITADEVRACWRAVGSFADTWVTFASLLAGVSRSSEHLSATELAYVFDAGAHFQTEALDQTVYTPPRLPTRGQLADVGERLLLANVAASWLVRRNVARLVFRELVARRGGR